MKIYNNPNKETWPELCKRPEMNIALLKETVNTIISTVREKGDEALINYAAKYDKVHLKTLQVSKEEIAEAENFISPSLKEAILYAKENIYKFHSIQQEAITKIETRKGITVWRKSIPIEKVGFYIPGGTAPLFSTILMLAVPASIAGVPEIILCTPSSENGKIHPAILYTASICGITKIFKTGGAQAIAAMALGTQTIPSVYKIFGPGNQYVTAAKQILGMQEVAIDMPAGPSELAVFADDTANASFVAADLLSQAEHGKDSQVVLVTTSSSMVQKVSVEIEQQVQLLPRNIFILESLSNSKTILMEDASTAMDFLNEYAPEHLIIASENADILAEKVINAGSVFLGNYSPEAAGDYASGTNHTLPTNGYAKAYSGVSTQSFFKIVTFQKLTKAGLANLHDPVALMAETEGLEAHKRAVTIRFQNNNQ